MDENERKRALHKAAEAVIRDRMLEFRDKVNTAKEVLDAEKEER